MSTTARERRLKIWKRDGYKCHYCGCAVFKARGDNQFNNTATVDHVIPRSKGGTNHASNLVTACRRCNNAKDDQIAWDGSLSPATALRRGWRW